jgi:SAM-dependent methyltransferase
LNSQIHSDFNKFPYSGIFMHPSAYIEMAQTESRHWWFVGRRTIVESVIKRLKLPANAKILEIGSGTGGNLNMLSQYGELSAVEMDATARSIALRNAADQVDIRQAVFPAEMPFRDTKFDLICLFDVLEHIDRDTEALIALKGLLAEGGRVLITVPAYGWLWSVHDEFLHHKRRYSRTELCRKVGVAGLRTTEITHFNSFLLPLAAVVRLKDKLLASRSSSGNSIPWKPINYLLKFLFSSERHILGRARLPFGVSLLAVLQNK